MTTQPAGGPRKLKAAIIGFGLDGMDSHQRLSTGAECLLVGGSAETHAEMLETMREHLVEGPDGRFRTQCAPAAVIVAWSEMAELTPPWPRCPTLVVCGEKSWIRVSVPRIGHIVQVVVPGGHSVLWDDFEATADAIVRFLA